MDYLINKIYYDYMQLMKKFIGNSITYSTSLHKKGKKLFGNRFLGVFPADQLPNNIKNRQMYIANLSNSDETGEHWISAFKHNNKLYVYDSFGRASKKIIPSIIGTGNVKDFEYDAEQDEKEYNCGLRSMVALYMMDSLDPEIVAKHL